MRKVKAIGLLLLLTGLLSASLGMNSANATFVNATQDRHCWQLNDVLCVNFRTEYNIDCGDVACVWTITDKISGSARLLAGSLEAKRLYSSPGFEGSLSSCTWPGVPGDVGCTHTRTYHVWVNLSGCQDFTLESRGTARFKDVPISVTGLKIDDVTLCGNGNIIGI